VEAHRKDPQVWHGLVDNDQWQTGYLSGDKLAELKFWLGEKAMGAPAPQAAHSASSVAAPAPAKKKPPAKKKTAPKKKK
jgi:hypothetical protein